MRKQHDSGKTLPPRSRLERQSKRWASTQVPTGDEVEPLTRAQRQVLNRRLRDSRDPTRYLVASVPAPHFILYYNVSDDTFAVNNPRAGTLFKSKVIAEAVRRPLGRHQTLLTCQVRKNGQLILSSLPKRPKTWMSAMRTV